MQSLLILFISFLIGIGSLFSQNYLFQPHQSGPHIVMQYYNPGHENTFVLTPGYTFNGRLTTGLIGWFSSSWFSNKKMYGANASYLLIKEGIDLPFSLSFDGSYLFGKRKTNDERFNTHTIGPSIYKRFSLSKKISLIPGVNLAYN